MKIVMQFFNSIYSLNLYVYRYITNLRLCRGYNSRLIKIDKLAIPKSESREPRHKKDKKQKRKARLALVVVRVFNGKLEVD